MHEPFRVHKEDCLCGPRRIRSNTRPLVICYAYIAILFFIQWLRSLPGNLDVENLWQLCHRSFCFSWSLHPKVFWPFIRACLKREISRGGAQGAARSMQCGRSRRVFQVQQQRSRRLWYLQNQRKCVHMGWGPPKKSLWYYYLQFSLHNEK